MAVRLVVTITAAPGKGSELAQAYRARCEECMKEPGCELDPRSLEDPHWCQGRQRPGARLLDFALLEVPTPAVPVWRRQHGDNAPPSGRSRCP